MLPIVGSTDVVILAAGKSVAERNNARGHLFEQFIAKVLELYGYEPPTTRSLNQTSSGIELDVVTKHVTTGHLAMAECKAYSTNVPVDRLSSFYGDLAVERMSVATTYGYFVALPRLTSDGEERARTIARTDKNFKLLTATEIVDLLAGKGLLREPTNLPDPISDRAVIVTPDCILQAAKQLDATTRLAKAVIVWGPDPLPDPSVQLLAESDYASGLPMHQLDRPAAIRGLIAVTEPTVVEVAGGSGDFEYQLPASPRFFVGRRSILQELTALAAPTERRGRVVVFNAQSGWGKSSLALRYKSQVEASGGVALVVDSRTAAGPDFVNTALRKAALRAEAEGLLELPVDASYAGLTSSLDTIERARWLKLSATLLLFFDQFENVFQDERTTREFRDLALATAEKSVPLTVGFAWKTDLIGWTENHPYRLRDEIKSRATVVTIGPFGPPDLTTLLRRLEAALGSRINNDLSRRLREYSQGLPWLFKKLASHLLRELGEGKSQEALLAEGLNVQGLFEADLAELGPAEQEGLKAIARSAPVPISEVGELVSHPMIQSFIDRRLVVAVGERLDIYWDIFRDFLNTGRVPVRETYILRVNPAYVARLLAAAIRAGGSLSVGDAAQLIRTSEGVVFNASRDLRQMGVLLAAPGLVKVSDEILAADEKEEAIRNVISLALKRHRAYDLMVDLLDQNDGEVSISRFAEVLPEAFPAVQATAATWNTYARAFVNWFSYARLLTKAGDRIRSGVPQSTVELLGGARVTTRSRRSFPQCPPGPALRVVRVLAGFGSGLEDTPPMTIRKAIGDLAFLGVVEVTGQQYVTLTVPTIVTATGEIDAPTLASLIARQVPGGSDVLRLLEAATINPPTNREMGEILRGAQGASWSVATTELSGKHFFAWAQLALAMNLSRRRRRRGGEAGGLWSDESA